MVLWTVLAFATLGWIASEFSAFGLIITTYAGIDAAATPIAWVSRRPVLHLSRFDLYHD